MMDPDVTTIRNQYYQYQYAIVVLLLLHHHLTAFLPQLAQPLPRYRVDKDVE